MTRRKPAPVGVPTAARVRLLDEVYHGRVWWDERVQAIYLRPQEKGREPVDVSRTFTDLVAARWAFVEGYDHRQPPPVIRRCWTSSKGDDVLMEAAAAARKRGARR